MGGQLQFPVGRSAAYRYRFGWRVERLRLLPGFGFEEAETAEWRALETQAANSSASSRTLEGTSKYGIREVPPNIFRVRTDPPCASSWPRTNSVNSEA